MQLCEQMGWDRMGTEFRRKDQRSIRRKSFPEKHAREDSNLQPLVPKTSALSN